jgi:internalin A
MESPETDHSLLERLTVALGVAPNETEYNEQGYLIKLDLSSLDIPQLPEELGQLIHLQELYLQNNQLMGIPPELGQLANLQRLDLDNNQLTYISPELGQLANLEKLYLHENQLTFIPPEMSQLANLQQLSLDGNQLMHIPPELIKLANLQQLSLDGNQLTLIPPEMCQLVNLQLLSLDGNQLTHIPPELDKLTNLQELYLQNNQLTQILPELGQLANLQRLALDGNHLTQIPPELGQLANLQKLFLRANQLAHIPPELSQLTSLEKLSLGENQLTQIPPELGQLTNLEKLYLHENQLTSIPPELCQLANLQELYLQNNQLTQIPPELCQLANLQLLSLGGNQLTQIPPELCQLANLEKLYLGDNQLTQIPPELGQLANLQELYLQNNQLTQIPQELSQLANLQLLSFASNQLTQISPGLSQLANLERLSFTSNQLTQIPQELSQLANLQELYLAGNQLTQIPLELCQLANLQTLDLGYNQLTQISPELSQLANLQVLSLAGNQLTQIPSELSQLANLQELFLHKNQLTHIPSELSQLANLQELYLAGNQLTQIPLELCQLANLLILELDNNSNLLTPPPEIVSQGTQAILTFLQELHREHVLRYEAKLILVGEGGTGKSSLLRAFDGKDLDASLETTHGVEVGTLILPHPALPEQPLILDTWDFGGQEIYRATHQFFLTKRSLYLVVWNARLGAEQGRLDYWLSTIRVLAPDVPILLVSTHIDEHVPDLNIPQYCADYPQIVEVLEVSNKTHRGIDELKQAIAKHAAKLPLMGQPWPMSWVKIEQELVTRPEHHISSAAYMDLCMAKGVHAELAQGSLGSYLHDLGKILYFRDDPILKDIVILKPNWVTKAISFVLEDEKTRDRSGILVHAELPHIWAADEQGQRYDSTLYPLFLRLMERFDLCYQIDPQLSWKHATHSLIPQLLLYQPPSSLPTWTAQDEQAGKVHVEMIYYLDFVPAGIMSWFIVRTHRYTCNMHWREGVVLSYQDHWAQVELFSRRNELRLEVWGVEPRTFLVMLKETLDLILSRFEGLQVRREVPCICHRQTGSLQPCPKTYHYEEDLVERLNQGRETIECRKSYQLVKVRELLYGIHISTTQEVRAVVSAGQQEILQHLHVIEGKTDLLLYDNSMLWQRINQLCEWNIRQFTRLWNLEMRKMEAECPNTFYLILGSKTPFNPKNWISYDYKLFLVCQYPSGPHCIRESKGYDLRQTKDWWIKVSPWLKYLIEFLKFGVPIAGKVLDIAVNEETYKQLGKQIDLLEQIIENIPQIAEHDPLSLEERHHPGGFEQNIGPAMRVLHSFLKEADPHQYWDGLEKVVTEDGNILWLCHEHARPYQVHPLQL